MIAIAHQAALAVEDNSAGMAPETLERIFNVFMSTKGARGTGLGLAVSRKILREHGGDIRATSREGEGSSFVLEFSARFAPEGGNVADAAARAAAPGLSRRPSRAGCRSRR